MANTADDLLTAFRLGKKSQQNFGMQISKKLPPGQGGSPGQAPPKPHPGPFVPAPKKNSLKIANLADGRPDASMMNYVTEKGFFLDGRGNAYQQRGGQFGGATEYNPDIHGLPVPLVKNKQRSQLQIA